jgi:hypothetical protein
VIQSSGIRLKNFLGPTFGAENVNKVFTDSPVFPIYLVFTHVSLSFIVIIDFYNMETGLLNIMCQLTFLFEKKEILPVVAFYNYDFRVLLFEYFSNRVVGTCQTCYRYACPSLLSVL